MRRPLISSLLLFVVVSVSAATSTLPELFLKAKEQFRLAAYSEALATLVELQTQSERPGNEAYRTSLAPGLAFYRGACLAALGRREEARAEFEQYLAYQPNASLDPSIYPPRVIAALDEARAGMQKGAREPARTGSFAAAYRAFPRDAAASAPGADESWAEGPVHYLLTAQQRLDYGRLSDPVSRSDFVTEFWKTHDPHPETPENEFREEFERRVAFADARLAQDETRGSLTDRGMVFVLLGPPTYVGRKPIAAGEDTAEPQGMSRFSQFDINQALKGTSGPSGSAGVISQMSGPGNTLPDSESSWREVWHYRRELLPPGISYHQVDFEFITKKGYGKNVLQRDDQTLTTIEAAKSAGRTGALTKQVSK